MFNKAVEDTEHGLKIKSKCQSHKIFPKYRIEEAGSVFTELRTDSKLDLNIRHRVQNYYVCLFMF